MFLYYSYILIFVLLFAIYYISVLFDYFSTITTKFQIFKFKNFLKNMNFLTALSKVPDRSVHFLPSPVVSSDSWLLNVAIPTPIDAISVFHAQFSLATMKEITVYELNV